MPPTPLILAQLKRLFRQVRRLPVGQYPIPVQHRLRHLLTATIEALYELYASSLCSPDAFRYQLLLNQMHLVQQTFLLTPTLNYSLLLTEPPPRAVAANPRAAAARARNHPGHGAARVIYCFITRL
ncbi:hypothetical protein J0X19_21970 [Hymenobacter sp. BT186]|uniref:Uncharacterized protein n=1 Tax=Hymenobacter telluris TaxID=2816474 RepID=A0A939JF51_9BACT|nr:hypothetical protein [Hymenobacter telluris]MBO0360643.1 hypothetical protein [Hymenobacter telluris]MBW3376670.1 hypothetical protein [Hymenobacter norwichensis]